MPSRPISAYRAVAVVLGIGVVVCIGIFAWGVFSFTASGPLFLTKKLVLSKGTSLPQIARQLEQSGIIKHSFLFQAFVRFTGNSHKLKAGEFRFPREVSSKEVMRILIEGKTVVRKLTVPEGLLKSDVLSILMREGALRGRPDISEITEGSLMPDTYHFSLGDSREMLLERMRLSMAKSLEKLWASRTRGLPFSEPKEAIVLASIVEKETGVAKERPLIAGVFINRLRLGMRLQADPTVAYALTGGNYKLERALTRNDLKFRHPYNTYVVAGLPPGPICNPGYEALAAVLKPQKTAAIYFVADGSGGHRFSSTLEEHLTNVEKWRKFKKSQKK